MEMSKAFASCDCAFKTRFLICPEKLLSQTFIRQLPIALRNPASNGMSEYLMKGNSRKLGCSPKMFGLVLQHPQLMAAALEATKMELAKVYAD